MTLALIVRQVAIAGICLLLGLGAAGLLSQGLERLGVSHRSTAYGLMQAGCVIASWLIYRLFFRKTIVLRRYRNDDAEIIM